MTKQEVLDQARALIKHLKDNPGAIETLSKAKTGIGELRAAMKKDGMAMASPDGVRAEGQRANPSAAAKDGPTGGNESSSQKAEIKPDAKRPALSNAQRAGPSSQTGTIKKEGMAMASPDGVRAEGQRANPSAAAKDGPTGGNESSSGVKKFDKSMIKDEIKSDWKPKFGKVQKCEKCGLTKCGCK